MKRDILILIGVAVISIAIGVSIFFYNNGNLESASSTVANNQSSAVVIPFTELTKGKQSAIEKRVNYFITSTIQLNELWKLVGATGTPPTVDFNTHAVLAVFAGDESSTSIAVAKIEDADKRMVSIALAKLKGSCVTKQQTAAPYEIVAVPATSLPLAHEDIVTTVSCPK
ncbi:MAG: hypothetical protein Q8P23_02280 [bacterium]|nr:hypothetical protein [bacterium]